MNINAMMQQAKKMQAELEKAQKELAAREFVVRKQGIEIKFLGSRKITAVTLNKVLVDPNDQEILEDMIMLAVNEANRIIDEELAKINQAPGSNLPF